MAKNKDMTRCPNCKKEISSRLKNCTHCNAEIFAFEEKEDYFDITEKDAEYAAIAKPKPKNKKKILLFLFAALIAFVKIAERQGWFD